MHHTLKLYSRHREFALKFYMFWAKWTRIPVIGPLVRWVANVWGSTMEGGYLLTPTEAEEIVDLSEGLALGPCTCREVFRNCDNPVNVEIMLGLNRNIFVAQRPQDYREISKEEAKNVLHQCREHGLIHTIIKCREDYYAICNCCTCCCVPLRLRNQYGIGSALVRHPDIVREFQGRSAVGS
jgi:hypothetical protein